MRLQSRHLVNIVMTLLLGGATLLVLIPLAILFTHIVRMGISSISFDFFTQIPKPTGETGGGMANGIGGSALLIGLASAIGIPYISPSMAVAASPQPYGFPPTYCRASRPS